MRGGRQQLVVEKREGFLQRGGKACVERVAHLFAPQEPTPQSGSFVQRRLGPTAPITQGVDLSHALAPWAQRR
jgi:hypothetical protein